MKIDEKALYAALVAYGQEHGSPQGVFERDAMIKAIEAYEAARPEPNPWRGIDSAPGPRLGVGPRIFVARHNDTFGWVIGTAWWESYQGIEGWIAKGLCDPPGELGLAHPTHWMPIDPPTKH